MRKDQIRLLSAVIVAGLLFTWWGVLDFLGGQRGSTYFNEIDLSKGFAIPTADATFIMRDFHKMRVFLDTWQGLIVLAVLTSIGLAWIARTWSLVVLSLAGLAAYAGFLTFHWSTFQLSQVFGTDFIPFDYVVHLRETLDRRLAYERFEAGLDSIVWFAQAIFVRAPLFVALVLFPLTALIEIVRQRQAGRRRVIPATAQG